MNASDGTRKSNASTRGRALPCSFAFRELVSLSRGLSRAQKKSRPGEKSPGRRGFLF
jgi:hypothetical protein